MAIIKMEKIRLCVHKDVCRDVLRVIQKMEAVEFTEVNIKELDNNPEKTEFEFNYVSSRLDFAVEFLSKYENVDGKINKIKRAIEGNKLFITEDDFQKAIKDFYFNDIIDRVQDIQENINDIDSKIKDLRNEKEILLNWKNMEISLASSFETEKTENIFLEGDKDEINLFLKEIDKKEVLNHFIWIADKNIVFGFLKENKSAVLNILRNFEIEEIKLPKRRGTPKEELERIFRAERKAENEKVKLEKEAEYLASENLSRLKILADSMMWRKDKHDLIVSSPKKSDVVFFEGWIPSDKIDKVIDTIKSKTDLFDFKIIKSKNGEIPPVEIKNNALIRPFEAITRLYGLPSSKDLDPTPFLAGFFFIFFGLALTDVGYGLFLFVLSGLALLLFRLPRGSKIILSLLMLGGLSSVLVGLLFGGYFGVDIKLMPEFLQSIQIFDPIKSPIPIFYMALVFGVLQIIFGLFLGVVRDAKNGKWKDGILDNGPWIFLFLSLILWGASSVGYFNISSNHSIWFVYTSLVFLILTQGRKERGIFKKIIKGVLSLYNSINFFSDVLSYSRLLALGLATSALAFAVNLIAQMANEMIPVVGGVLMVLILVIGHLFNLAVNLLGAFIHSARLQFVEFFGKFISGNGKNFMPFKRKERYIVISDKN